jgi:signal transduction histidine kinase
MTVNAASNAERGRDRPRQGTSTADQRRSDAARLQELILAEQSHAAELSAIIGAIGDGIVVVDRNGGVGPVNRSARRMLGAEPRRLDDILARFEGSGGIREALAHGPVQARLLDGDRRWLEITAYPVRDTVEAGTGAGGSIVVLRDVTVARERDEARDAFIGMLSHELRTPVTTIYAGSKLLARGRALSEATRASIFEDIHTEAERLHRLVEDVVALTRSGEGALEVGNDPVLVQRVIPAVARSEEGRWPGSTIEVRLEPDLPPVSGDATYVEQVVRNLLSNAMKYGGPRSSASIQATAVGDEVEVRVLDDGPGFPPAEANRLFELYYRSASVKQQVSGSGIGLNVCARLIDAMGGRIWAANRSSGGAEFGFALRAMAAER